MDIQIFLETLKAQSPSAVAEELLLAKSIHAFSTTALYDEYKKDIISDHGHAHHVAIVGSANWKFSLNPHKNFREFHSNSDIDVAIICAQSYLETWDDLRKHHRTSYYSLDFTARQSLKRFGENVYSGFVSPKWIPSLKSDLKQRYEKLTNKYSTRAVGFKTVNMMYFRNMDEAIDYYVRGILAATR